MDIPRKTGHRGFDRKLDTLDFIAGNALTDVQSSGFIRSEKQLICNGQYFSPGHLRAYDLKGWKHIPPAVMAALDNNRYEKIILHEIRHFNSEGKRISHGWIVTDEEHKLLYRYTTGRNKSHGIMGYAVEKLTK